MNRTSTIGNRSFYCVGSTVAQRNPPVFTSHPVSREVFLGFEVIIRASCAATKDAYLYWWYNKTNVTADNYIDISLENNGMSLSSVLTIRNFSVAFAGEYQCITGYVNGPVVLSHKAIITAFSKFSFTI